ncbi:deoxynucleoside kinase [soil metagenome]
MDLERMRHIVIEGPIGAGKTSLARRLAERLNGDLLLEAPEQNPFLERFYSDPARYALPTQLFFLFQRVEQMRDLAQVDLFARPRIADFLLDKDAWFAELTLNAEELKLYEQVHQTLKPSAPVPDLVIALTASPSTLLERVERRGRGYEGRIEASYLAALCDVYARHLHHYDEAPLFIVDTEHLNPIDSDDDFELLLQRIRQMRGKREAFNVGPI